MNNYYYIIASLPELTGDRASVGKNADAILDEIKSRCTARDNAVIGFLEKDTRKKTSPKNSTPKP